jgi:WD repeat-containing protein 59
VKSIKAHSAKIYGIDWAHNSSRELVTCSLDKTIKLWDVDSSPVGLGGFRHSEDNAVILPQGSIYEPFCTIHTSYPVWRARDLPFGNGLLSLPQRGGDALEMWAHSAEMPHVSAPIEVFEGHADVVKEFVWRRGGRGEHCGRASQYFAQRGVDWGDFQLITWSKDKTLRFWPIDQDVLQVLLLPILRSCLYNMYLSFRVRVNPQMQILHFGHRATATTRFHFAHHPRQATPDQRFQPPLGSVES